MFENRKKNKLIILFTLYLLSGVIIRLFYLDQFELSPLFNRPLGPDVEEYTKWANNIIAGEYLWRKVHIHSPLYPYFLAILCIIFSSAKQLFFWVRLSQLTIALFAVIPLFLSLKIIYEKSGKKEKLFDNLTMIIFLFLWLFYPPLIYYMGELTSEVLLVPLLSVGIYSLYKSEKGESEEAKKFSKKPVLWMIGAGIFSGLAVIAHPLSLFFILFESIYLFIKLFLKKSSDNIKKHILNLVLFIFAAIIPLLPVVIYNTCILKENIPLQANSGFNLYLGNGPESDGTCRLRPGPEWDKIHNEAEKKASELGISKDRYFIKSTLNHIISNPFEWLKLIGKKSLYVWNHKEITAGADVAPIRYFTTFQRYTRWSFGVCAALALISIFINIGPDISGEKRKNKFFIKYRHFLIITAAFWIAQTFLVTSGRYRVGMLPAILILSSSGVSYILFLFYNFRKRTLVIIPAVILAFCIVYQPSPPYHPQREKAEAQSLYGEALLRQKRFKEAEKHLISALEIDDKWTRNYNLLGMVYEEQFKFDNAEALYNKAIELDSEDPEAYVNLATLYSSRKLNKSAEEYFNKALELKIRTPKLHYNYALYCFEKGELENAQKHYKACLELEPSNHMALNNLGIIAFQESNFEDAISYFKKALRVDPRNAQRMLNLSLAYLMKGDPEKALQTLKKAESIDPNIPEIKTFKEMIEKESKKK